MAEGSQDVTIVLENTGNKNVEAQFRYEKYNLEIINILF